MCCHVTILFLSLLLLLLLKYVLLGQSEVTELGKLGSVLKTCDVPPKSEVCFSVFIFSFSSVKCYCNDIILYYEILFMLLVAPW